MRLLDLHEGFRRWLIPPDGFLGIPFAWVPMELFRGDHLLRFCFLPRPFLPPSIFGLPRALYVLSNPPTPLSPVRLFGLWARELTVSR